MQISDDQWSSYERDGYLRLGRILDEGKLGALQSRIDEIMLGKAEIAFDRLLMQLDSLTGKYEDAGEQSLGWKGETLAYRKIQNLEIDPLFRAYVEAPVFEDICRRVYGSTTEIGCFRAMFMNKPARQGTVLPMHQDAWNYLDRQPLITVWTALDPATRANGCVQILPGTHKLGLVNPVHSSGFLEPEQAAEQLAAHPPIDLELASGEAVLLHNWLIHGSDINHSDIPRRAFSVCYMEAATKSRNGDSFTKLFCEPYNSH